MEDNGVLLKYTIKPELLIKLHNCLLLIIIITIT
jgi:hypothetical protein